jgi:two-component system, OmpR family, phosphate regulon sensor histidine kinase PhoR
MRPQGPLTIRHLIVAVLVVVVVNAQLTWWIIFLLRESRTRLRLERAEVTASCCRFAAGVASELERARSVLELHIAGVEGGPLPAPFTALRTTGAEPCPTRWHHDGATTALIVATPSACMVAGVDPAWAAALVAPPPGLECSLQADPARPGAPLPPPFEITTIQPSAAVWDALLDSHRRRVLMVVSEGSFFVLLLFVMIFLLWRTVRREVVLERQHRNFLSAITHELKSPLASMRLALETVLRGRADSGASSRFMENALQDTERLQSLVQKVLEVTRYSAGHASFDLRPTNLSALVDDCLRTFSSRAMAAGVQVDSDLQPDIVVPLDGEAFPIVISNLLENAIKYGGTIPEIRVKLRESSGRAVLEVSDNGPGVEPAAMPFIFNRFFRGGDEMTRTAQGTGLGLYLARQIVTAHRGAADIASTGPNGTTFRITLPDAEVLGGAE